MAWAYKWVLYRGNLNWYFKIPLSFTKYAVKNVRSILYKKSISAQSFLSHYCGCTIFFKGRINEEEVTNLENLWKNTNQFILPSSFLYDR